jgi:hypothetical protein
MPFQLKTVSLIIAPNIEKTNEKPAMVTMGGEAALRACL